MSTETGTHIHSPDNSIHFLLIQALDWKQMMIFFSQGKESAQFQISQVCTVIVSRHWTNLLRAVRKKKTAVVLLSWPWHVFHKYSMVRHYTKMSQKVFVKKKNSVLVLV